MPGRLEAAAGGEGGLGVHALAEAFGGFAQLGAARIKEFAKERFEEGILGVFRKGRTKEEHF